MIGTGEPVLTRYERVCFEKTLIAVPGKPLAAFLCPGHPLLDATIDLMLERYRDLMKQGAILVDENDPGEDCARCSTWSTASRTRDRVAAGAGAWCPAGCSLWSCRWMAPACARDAGPAPYLDYRPLRDDERALVAPVVEQALNDQDLEGQAIACAIQDLVPKHLGEVRHVREPLIAKTIAAVKDRLTKEIAYWDHRAEELKAQELAGRVNAKINSGKARQRADELETRLRTRLAELEQERQIAALPPAVIGGALVVPGGLLARLAGQRQAAPGLFRTRDQTRRRGGDGCGDGCRAPTWAMSRATCSTENRGYDVESVITGPDAGDDRLRFIEVKGRISGAETVTITKNEILTALNKPDDWLLGAGGGAAHAGFR